MQFDKFYVCNDMKILYVCVCVCVCTQQWNYDPNQDNEYHGSFPVAFFGPHSQAVIGWFLSL